MKLTKGDFKKYEAAQNVVGVIEYKINERVEEIILLIYEAFGYPGPSGWYYPDAMEGEMGTIGYDGDDDLDEIRYCGYDAPSLSTYAWDYGSGFPQWFLFAGDEKIVAHVKKGVEDTKEREKRFKEKRAAAKKKKTALAKAAKEKLTTAERKALGIK